MDKNKQTYIDLTEAVLDLAEDLGMERVPISVDTLRKTVSEFKSLNEKVESLEKELSAEREKTKTDEARCTFTCKDPSYSSMCKVAHRCKLSVGHKPSAYSECSGGHDVEDFEGHERF